MTTKIKNEHLASMLSSIGGSGDGTFVYMTIRKKGVVRGKAGAKQTYDNDLVETLIWTGFNYDSLVELSAKKLMAIWDSADSFIGDLAQNVQDAGYINVTIKDASEAITEIHNSLTSQNIDEDFRDITPEIPKDHIWEPLVVNGVKICGAKIYVGKACPNDPQAPVPGTLYISGVKLGDVVIEAAPKWKTQKRAKTVAKDIVRQKLPIGKYVGYRLNKDSYLDLTVGKDALIKAKAAGILIDQDAIQALFKVAS